MLLPPIGDFEAPEPCVKCLAELDFATLGLQGLALQVDDDKAGAGAIGNAHRNGIAGQGRPDTGLNDKGDVVCVDLPA
jgi:hypothetical protein